MYIMYYCKLSKKIKMLDYRQIINFYTKVKCIKLCGNEFTDRLNIEYYSSLQSSSSVIICRCCFIFNFLFCLFCLFIFLISSLLISVFFYIFYV